MALPTTGSDAATKAYVDTQDTAYYNSATSYALNLDTTRKTYVDTQDTSFYNSAKSYTDNSISSLLNNNNVATNLALYNQYATVAANYQQQQNHV